MLLYLLPAVLLVSVGGGWMLARASLRPINQIVETTEEITAHNMEQRIPEPAAEDEMRRLVQTLNEMIDRLQRSFDQVRQFTADASHELRTPLTILTGELELSLRSMRTPQEYQKTISSALDEVLRLSQIVSKLLILSRAEAGQLDIQHEDIHMKDLLEDLIEDAEVLASSKNITVSFDVPSDVVVSGDAPRMHELFLNLIDNAIKYSSTGASLHIALEHVDGHALVHVQDTGIGISKEDLSKIFDRFYRVDKARSRAIGGSGLGLSISKWIVDAHNGSIEVKSELGKGTEFIVSLPVKSEKRSEEETVSVPA
jgi:heavy metal sensor kinase